MPAAVAFGDIAKKAKGLLGGDAATGTFQLAPKLVINSTTASGVGITATAVQKGDKLDASVKAAYTTGDKKYSGDVTVDPSGKVAINTSIHNVGPGVKLTAAVSLPNPASSAKLTADYSSEALSIKSTVGLNASPVVDVALATAVKDILLGAEVAYDTAKADLTKYNFVAGYHAADFQASATLADKLSVLKLVYSHNVSAKATVGAELSRSLAGGATTFALAYARILAGGALTKLKLESSGALTALYQTKLQGGEKVTGSVQVQATNLTLGPKYGFALDLA
ncbi:hypothetical protein CHLRE_01g013700v5 [Chlamydomonas reinhardtii]|jgi:voltage-dependent anion channel protein 2|uniref:Uncharacterized protein n=1 Tax=Chlamydomonas reinhardtii TaxID=3055 RepID=A8HPF4_CHLRE|nr:uncharacterized protein CHLRE_01g013700v5 [Chlamydomonas reinhardtii]XP_042928269.1 uncharacterized protein CHLRE_01g013700v5 [Chlamydomonas reinhardtii]PNW88088.1 hypothetical protein CHLRE_01g013700v5 [Chlamydomonas reinhardtii]PNW88089.1 hypothetical protein CHLRE_01g013700v5 [Chlamydomonas reinhardtii]|eukprot:XP_001689450.1 predicted protein [Chlamydomonas reinhardtii]